MKFSREKVSIAGLYTGQEPIKQIIQFAISS